MRFKRSGRKRKGVAHCRRRAPKGHNTRRDSLFYSPGQFIFYMLISSLRLTSQFLGHRNCQRAFLRSANSLSLFIYTMLTCNYVSYYIKRFIYDAASGYGHKYCGPYKFEGNFIVGQFGSINIINLDPH